MSFVADKKVKAASSTQGQVAPCPSAWGLKASVANATAMPTLAPAIHKRCPRQASISGAHRNFTVQARPSRLSKPISAGPTPAWRMCTGNRS